MPFRERMKKALGGKKSGENTPEAADTPKIPGVEYYKPNKIPPPRFREKPDPAHVERLRAFSFSFGRRKSSSQSIYSPSGTKAQSRRASYMSRRSKSDKDDKSLRRKSLNPNKVPEAADDEADVANVGQSRLQTGGGHNKDDGTNDHVLGVADKPAEDDDRPMTANNSPFSAEDLERAITEVTMRYEV